MTSTYITEKYAGPGSAREELFSSTYERHIDDPIIEPVDEYVTHFSEDTSADTERHSTQTQKVCKN